MELLFPLMAGGWLAEICQGAGVPAALSRIVAVEYLPRRCPLLGAVVKREWKNDRVGDLVKATFYQGPGQFFWGEVEVEPPKAGQVQLAVDFCGICGTDLHIFQGDLDGRVSAPQTVGHEMVGRIVELGAEVRGWKPGEVVVVRPLDPCGTCPACRRGLGHICQRLNFLGVDSVGAMQQRWNVPAYTLHRFPQEIDRPLGALVEPLAVACHDVQMAEVQPGEDVVVLGGGPIGTLIALVAQQRQARVLVCEVSAVRQRLITSLGLNVRGPELFSKYIDDWTNGKGADVVFEVAGVQATASLITEITACRGRIIAVALHSHPRGVDLTRIYYRELKIIGTRVYQERDYDESIALVQSGELPLARVIGQIRPLSEIQSVFESLAGEPSYLKILLDCR